MHILWLKVVQGTQLRTHLLFQEQSASQSGRTACLAQGQTKRLARGKRALVIPLLHLPGWYNDWMEHPSSHCVILTGWMSWLQRRKTSFWTSLQFVMMCCLFTTEITFSVAFIYSINLIWLNCPVETNQLLAPFHFFYRNIYRIPRPQQLIWTVQPYYYW